MSARPGPHLLAVASVLLELSEDIEMLGGVLCADPAIAARHMQELQMIDTIAQKQRSLAMMLQCNCPVSALAEIGLEDLKVRLAELAGRAASEAQAG
jgi:hypothetical protein